MKISCNCIIPFYNEGSRVLEVARAVSEIKGISKIILVDDGSKSDAIYLALKKQFPKISIIRLEENKGKSEAIKEGLKYVDSDLVLLLDGDLLNIKANEFENAIQQISNNKQIDMIILRRMTDKTVIFSRWLRHDIIYSGQRILRTHDLKEIYKNKIVGYQIEVAINTYMMRNRKLVYWMPSTIQNLPKQMKWGWSKGSKNSLNMFRDFVIYAGLRNFVWQTVFFCHRRAIDA